ncbi:HAD family phosphatase [Ancylomarina salipaludis]|uniref:HAD family phosphatase n=1 Tax=Ancylomarina salipaludis TaxID=2501299 RepID=A0A4Q1JLG4_9BACT|nr:HAD family phosphatase [Ancylomarina salipaludis]RXQ92986.1 HAD family phosphatase [Ancylomarina salipaludis]
MPNFSSIPNIIFDLGGVLLNINPENSVNQFKAIGLNDPERIQYEYRENGLFDRLEKGLLSPQAFRDEIRQYIDAKVSDQQIDQAWNAMLLDFPYERLALLQELKKTHKVYLLSNTNRIHWEYYTKQIKETHGVDLADCFEKDYYSHDMGLRKPDMNIYQELLKTEKLKAGETLFIDDMYPNIEAAKAVGMIAHHLDLENGESVLDLFTCN